jgi:hypothetical protein
METRRFVIFYQRQRDRTLERDVAGTVETVLGTAWDMLQTGEAKVAAIVEPGNLEFHMWHDRIVRWGRAQPRREAWPAPQSPAPVPTMPRSHPLQLRRASAQRPAA